MSTIYNTMEFHNANSVTQTETETAPVYHLNLVARPSPIQIPNIDPSDSETSSSDSSESTSSSEYPTGYDDEYIITSHTSDSDVEIIMDEVLYGVPNKR